jgi:hypothetical protein
MSEAFLGAFLGAVLATLAANGLRNWKAALMEHKRDCRKQMKYYNKLMNESGDVGHAATARQYAEQYNRWAKYADSWIPIHPTESEREADECL